MTSVKVKTVVEYAGHSLSANGGVNFTLKSSYSELPNTIRMMPMLNENITIKAKLPGSHPMKLGMFRIKQVVIDGDGESRIKLNGLNDYIEMDNLNVLPTNKDDNKQFVVMLEATIEDEGEDDSADEA